MKQEMELSMKMLEKDICEKHDALVELRQQLDEMRILNHELSIKSQVCLNILFSYIFELLNLALVMSIATEAGMALKKEEKSHRYERDISIKNRLS